MKEVKTNMPKISIIVPVYKTEKYIHRCIDSILNQKFQDFELILVDDGSPDKCPAICDEYSVMDNRIKVIHKQNVGVSAARNTGLDIAEGEYITFVDSDDWIEQEMYQSMMNTAMQYDCDVVMCDCVKDFSCHSEIYSHEIRAGYYNYEQLKKEYYPHLLMMENVEYPPTISNWLCVFRRKLLDINLGNPMQLYRNEKLRYVEGIRFSEDLLFGAQMMYNARSFYYMKGETYYHYCMNQTSATHTFVADKWNDYLRLYEETAQFFLKKMEYDFRKQTDLMLLFFVYNAIGDIQSTDVIQLDEKKYHVNEILNNCYVRNMFKRVRVWCVPISWKLKIITAMYKCRIGLNWLLKKGSEKWNH